LKIQKKYFLTVCLNPCLDVNCYVDNLKIDDIIRIKQKKINAGGKTFNTAKFLSNCGVNVLAIGIIAGNNGRRFSNLLKNSKISHPMLLELPGETRENYNFFLKMDRY